MNGRGLEGVRLDDRVVERVLSGGAHSGDVRLDDALSMLRSLTTGPVPQPTEALAALLDTGREPIAVPPRPAGRPGRRWAARASAVLVSAAASLLVAGTASALPPALQDGVADLVAAFTPFELPRSADAEPAAGRPRPAPGDDGAASSPAPPAPPAAARPTAEPVTGSAGAPTSGDDEALTEAEGGNGRPDAENGTSDQEDDEEQRRTAERPTDEVGDRPADAGETDPPGDEHGAASPTDD